jgi:hypothetical protein
LRAAFADSARIFQAGEYLTDLLINDEFGIEDLEVGTSKRSRKETLWVRRDK